MSEQEQIDNCMNNSYTILTGRKSLSEILCEDNSSYFLWNVLDRESVEESIFIEIIDLLIEYFEDTEEYEKCAELLKLKKTDEDKHRRKIREINTVG
tara:strand:+ start:29 stop:319 length:291 start_codon:yes stop_codon:yes gene_type:complete